MDKRISIDEQFQDELNEIETQDMEEDQPHTLDDEYEEEDDTTEDLTEEAFNRFKDNLQSGDPWEDET